MNLPVVQMILNSDWMAKIILVILALFSITSWGIILNRFLLLSSVRRLNKRFIKFFKSLKSMKDLMTADKKYLESPAGLLGLTGLEEFKRIIADAKSHKGVTDWSFYMQNQFYMAQERFEAEVGRLSRKQDTGLYLLAVISSTAPFLGLFGTVWGIMLSFHEIGTQDSASLTVVAPGISAALITTIVGLAVAIPSVVFYNVFQHKVERIEDELEEYSDHLLLTLKRELFNMLYANKTPQQPQQQQAGATR